MEVRRSRACSMTGSYRSPCRSARVAAHKGHHGHVLVIGGGVGHGRALPDWQAKLHCEQEPGWSRSRCTRSSVGALAARPELMSVSIGIVHDLHSALERATVIALGPGLGQSPWAMEVLGAAMSSGKPLVVDADALNLLLADSADA